MSTDPENVCSSGRIGSNRRVVQTAILTHFGSRASPQIYFHLSPQVFQLLSLDRYTAASCCLGLGMLRRKFITLVGGAVAGWPCVAFAQARRTRPLIGWLKYRPQDEPPGPFIRVFLDGMRELGYAEGRDFAMVYRSYEGQADKAPAAALELVRQNPDIIIAPATLDAVAVKQATATIPIVVPALAEPVELGLVVSEARPGGNLTGIAPYVKGLPAKQLELAREIVPGAHQIGLLNDPVDPKARPQRVEIERAATALKVEIITADVRTKDDVGPAYKVFTMKHAEAVIVEQSTPLINMSQHIAEIAAASTLPSIYGYREHVEAGGLISYGVNLIWCVRRAAYFADRILKGGRPAELPVEFPVNLELVINLKARKGTWPHDPTDTAHPRRRGDRVSGDFRCWYF
jgi:putative tryptophan/tyrosine transport system substrate-binding protein